MVAWLSLTVKMIQCLDINGTLQVKERKKASFKIFMI